MLCSGTDPKSYITEYTLVYENNRLNRGPLAWHHHRIQTTGYFSSSSSLLSLQVLEGP